MEIHPSLLIKVEVSPSFLLQTLHGEAEHIPVKQFSNTEPDEECEPQAGSSLGEAALSGYHPEWAASLLFILYAHLHLGSEHRS